jgi:hypothetical protein
MLLLGIAWLLPTQRQKFTMVHGLAILWLGYAALATLWAPDWTGAWSSLLDLALLVGVLWIGEGEALLQGACVGIVGLGALACWESWQGQIVGQTLGNPNYLGEAAALGISWALVGQHRALALCLLPALALSGSRASLLGLALALAWIWFERCEGLTARSLLVGAALAAALGAVIFADNSSLLMRAEWWQHAIGQFKWLGNSPGSFWTQFPLHNTAYFQGVAQERPEWPHNELVDWTFTLGVGAIVPVWLSFLLWQDRANRPIWLCAGAIAILGFPLHTPCTILLLGACASLSSQHLSRIGALRRAGRDPGPLGLALAHPTDDRRGT